MIRANISRICLESKFVIKQIVLQLDIKNTSSREREEEKEEERET